VTRAWERKLRVFQEESESAAFRRLSSSSIEAQVTMRRSPGIRPFDLLRISNLLLKLNGRMRTSSASDTRYLARHCRLT
jgi:hypothetical protein